VRFIVAIWILFSLWQALMSHIQISMLGFPDGYIAPYQLETRLPLQILALGCLAQAIGFLYVGLVRRRRTPLAAWLGLSGVGFLVVAAMWLLPACPGMTLCQDAYQALSGRPIDDGAGG
jgi:hypothetical protein